MLEQIPEGCAPKKKKKTVIGWSEYIDFPDWHIRGLKAKVDTGARSSALHVEELVEIEPGVVSFYVVLNRKSRSRRHVQAPIVKWARVRSSTGIYRRRCFVRTRVAIGAVEKEIEVSLVCREKMLFRMLLGRQALRRDFVVDVNKRAVLGRPSKVKRTESHEDSHPQP